VKRTTIFLPERLHEQLRREAFRANVSMAELIRERLKNPAKRSRVRSGDPILKVAGIALGPAVTDETDRQLYGF